MEGVGARLGRSSTRYGPTTVFSGPVRRWKKNWVPLSNPNHSNSNGNNTNHSHLLLYKWTPIIAQSNGATASTPPPSGKESASAGATTPNAAEELHRRKFRYIPVSVLEEQKQEGNVKSDDESKPDDVDSSLQPAQVDITDREADGNDVLMEEAQALEKEEMQTEEASETNLDLSLGLKARDGLNENDPKAAVGSGSRPEAVILGNGTEMKPSANSEPETRKRKASAANWEMRM